MATINTKYSLGEKVYLMANNKSCEGKILKINIICTKNEICIYYITTINPDNYKEEDIFCSKQELLNTL